MRLQAYSMVFPRFRRYLTHDDSAQTQVYIQGILCFQAENIARR